MQDGVFNSGDPEFRPLRHDTGDGTQSDRDPVELLAEQFSNRRRMGEELTIESFAAEHPQYAAEIREIFPAIAAIERAKDRQASPNDGRVAMSGQVPARLGDFRLIREIGRGGMGVVYEALQVSLGRRVAIKVLPRQFLPTGKTLRRFEREARTAAKLHHTNIVPVFGIGEQDGYHYIVMQLIAGVGLDEVLVELRRAANVASLDAVADPSPRGTRAHQKAVALLSQDFALVNAASPGLTPADSDVELKETDHASLPTSDVAQASVPGGNSIANRVTHGLDADGFDARNLDINSIGRSAEQDPSLLPDDTIDPVVAADRRKPSVIGGFYWRNVARIAMQVAEALAHQQGTLHRDIKPGNLLLDQHATLWVADFGLAKRSDYDDVSQTGDIVGTLNYIAPEVLAGRTDRRSDIYSLGLTLYELLALRAAHGSRTHARVLEAIRQANPKRPSYYQPSVPRDLETIVLKAIAAEPDKRYATAAALAEDLHRFLEDRPIRARRASLIEHGWRWCRRNRGVAALSAILLGLIVSYAAIANVGYVHMSRLKTQAQDLAEDALMQRRKAEDERTRAEETLVLAIDALDNVYARFVPDHAVDSSTILLDDATGDAESEEDAGTVIQVRPQPALSNETAAFLQEMLGFYDKFAEKDEMNMSWRLRAATASRKVGDVLFLLGKNAEADDAYRKALQRNSELTIDDDKLWLVSEVEKVRASNGLAMTLAGQGQFSEAFAEHRKGLQGLRAVPAALRNAPELRAEEARTLFYLSRLPPEGRGGPGRGPRREAPFREGLADRRPHLPQGDPVLPPPGRPGPEGRPERAGRHPEPKWRGRFPFGKPRHGEDYLQQAIQSLEKLAEEFPLVAEHRYLLALAYRSRADKPWDQDDDLQHRAVEILEGLVADYPSIPDYRDELCRAYAGIRWIPLLHLDDRRPSVSAELLEKSRELSRVLVEEHPNIPRFRETYALVQQQHGRQYLQDEKFVDAESDLRASAKALATMSEKSPHDPHLRMLLETSRMFLARALAHQNNVSPEHGKEAVAIMEQLIHEATREKVSEPGPGFRGGWGRAARIFLYHAENLRIMGEANAADEVERRRQQLEHRSKPPFVR